MQLPETELAIIKGSITAGNKIMDAIKDGGYTVDMAKLLKLQPEIKSFAAECVQHWYYAKRAGAKVEEVKLGIDESKEPVQALVNITLDFVKQVAKTTNELELVPVAIYYFPLMAYCMQVNIDQLAAMDFEIPRP